MKDFYVFVTYDLRWATVQHIRKIFSTDLIVLQCTCPETRSEEGILCKRNLQNKTSDVREELPPRLPYSSSTSPKQLYETSYAFQKMQTFLSVVWGAENLGLLTNRFRQVFQKPFHVSQLGFWGKTLSSQTFFILVPCRIFSQNFWTIVWKMPARWSKLLFIRPELHFKDQIKIYLR